MLVSGLVGASNDEVFIQAYDPVGHDWERIAAGITSSSTPNPYVLDAWGETLFSWQRDLVIPDRFWEAGWGGGYRAAVRAREADAPWWDTIVSVRKDWLTCFANSDGPREFALNCSAPYTPVARVYTADYAGRVPLNDYCADVADSGEAGFWGEWPHRQCDFEEQVLEAINEQRATRTFCGRRWYGPSPPLTMEPALRCAARTHSKDQIERGTFEHSAPIALTLAGYTGEDGGENILETSHASCSDVRRVVQAVVQRWVDSPPHCLNLMVAGPEAGLGHYSSGTRDFWTLMFGHR